MARWPDPILRHVASTVPPGNDDALRNISQTLRDTARKEGAVGMAAQQCGVDASVIFLELDDDNKNNNNGDAAGQQLRQGGGGLIMINPKIISRSSEIEMKAWTEHCLVLPPSFRATVLRDAEVTIEYESLLDDYELSSLNSKKNTHGRRKERIMLTGEQARAAQHEMDHDRGVLIVDHVGLEEMLDDDMRRLEEDGHEERMRMAYWRGVVR